MNATKQIFRTKDAAAYLGVSKRTLHRLVARKLIQQKRVPPSSGHQTQPRYTREALDAFLASGYTAGLR